MNNQIQDERILSERRTIQSKAYGYIIYALVFSIVIKMFFMDAGFELYATELLILIGSGLYIIVANYFKGINIWSINPNDGTNRWINNLIIATLISIILSDNFIKHIGIKQSKLLAITYSVAWILVFSIVSVVMNYLNKKKQEKIDKQLDDDE
ncbi:MAG: DUF6773 family protein [Catonella sp.]|uniref:DUF6773 family protein n=1 Tax=Catonella sp. TaxID=2382125 RepID=UPI003F9FDECD